MTGNTLLRKSDFFYDLPEDRIAKYPLPMRDQSKLLQWKESSVTHHCFHDLPDLIPAGSLVVFNNTQVIPARMLFQRKSGAWIEIFLLKPILPSDIILLAMESNGPVVWEAMIGNLKKWKDGEILENFWTIEGREVRVSVELTDRNKKHVRMSWDSKELTFAELVEAAGKIPLPPYLNREPTPEDRNRYQTVYSQVKGAVAAPTAGLHFTPRVLEKFTQMGIETDYLTLHVSAGTFQPIKEEAIQQHPMHGEQIVFTKANIENLLKAEGKIVAVGTTSMRSLESLYWFGIKLISDENPEFTISKDYAYQAHKELPTAKEVLKRIYDWMTTKGVVSLIGHTEIYIYPGYTFRVVSGLVTNFHQPGSTLILLVAAFTNNEWKKIYREAMDNEYRFLSYGDSSILWL
ncbi:MAG TPA: S-adenosylmethionine:tRNA ribosyltransferase-isomerase [Lunatimonas sp.]|nr:S-adenosylmethionine:tRNA ribosyltransferase-isomerase [Lunatimonas sp.]